MPLTVIDRTVNAEQRPWPWWCSSAFRELWRTDKFADVSLRQWLAFTPYELVRAHLKLDRSVLAKIPSHKTPVVPC